MRPRPSRRAADSAARGRWEGSGGGGASPLGIRGCRGIDRDAYLWERALGENTRRTTSARALVFADQRLPGAMAGDGRGREETHINKHVLPQAPSPTMTSFRRISAMATRGERGCGRVESEGDHGGSGAQRGFARGGGNGSGEGDGRTSA